jgi:hypothetical protein
MNLHARRITSISPRHGASAQPEKPFRPLAFLMAFLCSMALTGCGGGGGGGGGVSPIGPGGQTLGTVDGYVSNGIVAPSVRANLGALITAPAGNAEVTLLMLDAATGAERVLGTGQTDDQGYYQVRFDTLQPMLRNLIVRARAGNRVYESLLPRVTHGAMVRAPLMDPNSNLPVKIVQEAAKFGRHTTINVGELLAILSPEALKELEARIGELVSHLVAREAAKEQVFGARLAPLRQYAFDLQQRVNEAIDKGELTAAEGWKLFSRELAAWAKERGFTAADLQTLDDLNQAFVFEPFKNDLKDSTGLAAGGFALIEAERLKERKLLFLQVVADSVRILAGSKAGTDFAAFFPLVERVRGALTQARTPEEIQRFFQNNSSLFLEFGTYLSLALAEVGFSSDLVAEVFQGTIPAYGFTGGITESGGTTMTVAPPPDRGLQDALNTAVDPTGRAIGFVQWQEQIITALMERVRTIAAKVSLVLRPDQMKAVAYLIWAQGEENLNFPAPPPPIPGDDPTEPGKPYPITAGGRVAKLAQAESVEHLAYSFTHQLLAGYDSSAANMPQPVVALLAEDDAAAGITLIKTDEAGIMTRSIVRLADLEAYPFLELEGLVVKSPYYAYPMPMPVPAPDEPVTTMPWRSLATPGAPGAIDGSPGTGGNSSSEPWPGAIDPVPPAPYPYEIEPMYLVVKSARVLPPPPPPPTKFIDVPGRIVQPVVGTVPVPELFVFESADEPYNAAILEAVYARFDSINLLSPARWVGRRVLLSGVLFIEPTGRKMIHIADIKAAP